LLSLSLLLMVVLLVIGYIKNLKIKEPLSLVGFLAGEVIPMAVGGYAGSKFWQKYAGFKATIGRTKLSEESLIPKEVLSGKEIYWSEPKSKHLKLFTKDRKVLSCNCLSIKRGNSNINFCRSCQFIKNL